jgi:hypothetical protein
MDQSKVAKSKLGPADEKTGNKKRLLALPATFLESVNAKKCLFALKKVDVGLIWKNI